MNKNKGFTLLEVIGVVVILSLILIVSLPSLTRTLKRNEQKKYNAYLDNIVLASENYFVRKVLKSESVDSYTITLGDLIDEEYITEVVVNPANEKKLSRDTHINITKKVDNTYNYEVIPCYQDEVCE